MQVNELSKALEIELETYSNEVAKELKAEVEIVAKECVQELKQTSPKSNKSGSKSYANGWVCKKTYEDEFCSRYKVKNKNKPQLTHLLEYGHAKVNGGRVEARPHIKRAEENAKEKLLKTIKEKRSK